MSLVGNKMPLRVAAETANIDAADPFRDRKASDTDSATCAS